MHAATLIQLTVKKREKRCQQTENTYVLVGNTVDCKRVCVPQNSGFNQKKIKISLLHAPARDAFLRKSIANNMQPILDDLANQTDATGAAEESVPAFFENEFISARLSSQPTTWGDSLVHLKSDSLGSMSRSLRYPSSGRGNGRESLLLQLAITRSNLYPCTDSPQHGRVSNSQKRNLTNHSRATFIRGMGHSSHFRRSKLSGRP